MGTAILAADDDEYVRVIVETKLGDDYDVVTVPDGSDAWAYLTAPDRQQPSLEAVPSTSTSAPDDEGVGSDASR